MKSIFLGKVWHWALVAAAAGLLWFCGSKRLHVIEFNTFVILMIAGTALSVLAVVWFHRPGDQVTRDVLSADDNDGGNSAGLAGD
jgi:hypothetical protein